MKNQRRTKFIAGIAFSAVLLAATTSTAGEPWVDAWNAFAAKSGDANHKAFAKKLASPKAVALAKDWTKLRGYNAYTLMAKVKLPADLKPGLIITKANAAQYPWLKKYLPKASYDRLMSSDWFKWGEIEIVPTASYYMSRSTLEATKKAMAEGRKFTATQDGALLNEKGQPVLLKEGALPFIHPKNGLQLNWLFYGHGNGVDNLVFKPMKMNVCNKNNKIERQYEADLWMQKFHHRMDTPPLGDIKGKDGVIEGGAIFFLKPRDIRGLAGVRLRYADPAKDDDFRVFIPGLRRTRVLAGSDAQDPLAAGVEVTWDEWRSYWVKTNPKAFSYKMVGETFILAQPETGYVYDPATMTKSKCEVKKIELELRPVWILEIKDKTGKYQYATRRLYIDKELYYMQYEEMFDAKENLWRVWDDARAWDPERGIAMWRNALEWNPISNRLTELVMTPSFKTMKSEPKSSTFDIDRLRDYK